MAINKSKRYDEAIKVAKSKIKNDKDHVLYENDIIEIFPELKESEDDRIRKELIAHIKWCEDSGYCAKEEMTRWITWLEKQGKPIDKIVKRAMTEKQGKQGEQNLPSFDESQGTPILKQGEQKPADNVEPKFKVADWVVDKNGIVKQILSYKDGIYKHTNGYSSKMFEDEWRIWDITKDAKDGDVLAAHECYVIFKEIDGLNIKCYCTYHFMNNESFFVDTLQNKTAFVPATEEQSNLLFQKMREAGYEWDAEKKELKKIKQKPAEWNEKDENEVAVLEAYIRSKDWSESHIDRALGIVDELVNKVKSLRPQPQWKPSDEQTNNK